ncbi:MAG: bifunctional lysylphosphatidylglycerol synthetase/lysine--tRNA ligase LysX [Mobilicoccus sp.]|nr:bifunctional lysylphosphatidylglycerol synthetase/lysine--tRNA ligase LysX [Mobilicoccus sp.]
MSARRTDVVERDVPHLRPATGRQEVAARLLLWLYALATLTSFFLWLIDHWGRRPVSWVELAFAFVNIPVSSSLVSVVILALTTRALLGRKRVGLLAFAFFQVLGVVIGVELTLLLWSGVPPEDLWGDWVVLGQILDLGAMAVAVGGLALAWWLRPCFPGRLRAGSWTTLAATIVLGVAVTVLLTWALLTYAERDVTDPQVVRSVVLHALGLGGTWAGAPVAVPPLVSQSAAIAVSATIIIAVILFTRSGRDSSSWSPDQELHLRGLLREWGDGDSLGYFATRRDKSVVFSGDGRAAVAYDVVSGVALAAGDPVGDPASWDDAIVRWKARARWFGWVPAILGASETGARRYVSCGFDAIVLGDEAVLHPSSYRINNTSMTEVRRAVRRARRAGLTVTIRRQHEIDEAEVGVLVGLADAWRDGGTERGFSMALDRRGDASDGRTLWVTAQDENGRCVGLLTFVPWGATGLSLDTMRRAPDAPNGVTELLVTSLMEAGDELGIRQVSLNFAMLRGVFSEADRLGAGVITRLNSSLLGGLDRFFQLERLYRSNQKFEPTWRPRFLCLDSRLSFPQVGLAAARAEGFLPRLFHGGSAPALDAEHVSAIRALESRPALDAASLAPRRGDQTRVRMDRVAALRAQGTDPYAVGVAPADQLASLDGHDASERVRVCGRVRAVRDFGGVCFADLVEGSRTVQVLVEDARLSGTDSARGFRRDVDGGDLIVVEGELGTSRTGTVSVLVDGWTVVAKALHPVPFDAFDDPETRLRQRATDLIVHPEAADALRVRSAVVKSIRDTLDAAGYMEVETPILHTIHGGASARPFTTFSNAYGVDLSLRIAPELYLKRLVVAGMGKVFEMGRNFRNEGADATHNPEFTSLEAYEPFGDYTTMRHLTERIVKEAATAVHGSPVLPLRPRRADGDDTRELIDVSGPWAVVSVLDAVSAAVGCQVSLDMDFEVLLDLARSSDIPIREGMGPGAIIEELYAELVEDTTVEPTFYVDFPVETSPLTGAHRSEPGLVERWDLVVDGMELGTAYSELTDPIEQRRRLTEQSLKAALGDPEAMEVDEEFLRTLETGMPPTGGLGIGVDRLAMLILGTNIRGVLTFPFVRPQR